MPNPSEFPMLLVICDGLGCAHTIRGDDPLGMTALAHDIHELGYACWLRDTDAGELVACSTAACYDCHREKDCDHLEMAQAVRGADSSDAFLARLMLRLGENLSAR